MKPLGEIAQYPAQDTATAESAVVSTTNGFEGIDPQLALLLQRAQQYYTRGKAQATREAYQNDWQDFTDWCATHRLTLLPAAPATVALYLTASIERGQKVNTLARRLAAISHAHQAMGYATPTTSEIVRAVLIGIRRTHGKAPRGAGALMTEDIRRIIAALPDAPVGLRDKALILLGFAGAFRRSELIAMNVDDLHERQEGLVVLLRPDPMRPVWALLAGVCRE
jgi:site-specific recombinase XerD